MAEITREAAVRLIDRYGEANRELGEHQQIAAERAHDPETLGQLASARGRAYGLREALHLALDLDHTPPF